MEISNIWTIIGIGSATGLFFMLIALFFISRKSQHVMQSMLDIIMEPGRSKVRDASRVLQEIMAGEIDKIAGIFQNIHTTLKAQTDAANTLHQELTNHTDKLVTIANDATKKIAVLTGRLDNTVTGLEQTIESEKWNDVINATDRFSEQINQTLKSISETTDDANEKISVLDTKIAGWTTESKKLASELQTAIDGDTANFEKMTGASNQLQTGISELIAQTTQGFTEMKNVAANYETTIRDTNKILGAYLAKLDSFDKQAKKQLTSQMNTLTNTANIVGAQVILTETSVEKQIKKLTEAVETVITSATETESSVRGITAELTGLTNHFETEIKDFATDVVSELKTVSGVANSTLGDTKTAANAFSESVKSMATGVRETLIEMNAAHTQLSGQSAGLIQITTETTNQLRPLAELIEKYYSALPELSASSETAGANLAKTIAELSDKIALIKNTVAESAEAVSESAGKLETLTGQSRQQMIDLMADYAKAVDTMQTLNKQMMIARAAAPMDAISNTPISQAKPRASSRDFLTQSTGEFDKLYELTIDLTRAMGNDIPDIVWKKYHDGDKTIFAKWLAKMLKTAGKKRVQEMIKSDSVFRSQAIQFARAFDKLLNAAQQTDTPDKLVTALTKTDLGTVYTAIAAKI